jgi:hypothetical protein
MKANVKSEKKVTSTLDLFLTICFFIASWVFIILSGTLIFSNWTIRYLLTIPFYILMIYQTIQLLRIVIWQLNLKRYKKWKIENLMKKKFPLRRERYF